MPKKRKYTDEQFIEAVKTSFSIREIINKLGLIPAGGNYQSCYNNIERLNLNINHLKGQGWKKGSKPGPIVDISEYLLNKRKIQSYKLKVRLFNAGLKQNKCECCGQSSTWNEKPLTMHLDHIDGNRNNNSLSNLQILCPNCHSQTSTYAGKNKGNGIY